MSDERNRAYATAAMTVAAAEGNLATVQAELDQISRLVSGNEELRGRLTDANLPASRRSQIVEDLLGGKASDTAVAIVSMIVGAGRGRDLPAIIDAVAEASASAGGKQVATVRSAIELTDDQKSRLAAALQKATGSAVELRVVIDPSVLGGLVAQVGDTVIDGTVRRRLEQLKQAI